MLVPCIRLLEQHLLELARAPPSSSPLGGLVEQQQLWNRVEGIGEQHALQLAAGQRAEWAAEEADQADACEQIFDAPRVRASDAEADRAALAGQSEELADGQRQCTVDGERLRHVADASGAPPVKADAAAELDQPEDAVEQRALAGAVRARRADGSARAVRERDAAHQGAPITVDGEAAISSRGGLPPFSGLRVGDERLHH